MTATPAAYRQVESIFRDTMPEVETATYKYPAGGTPIAFLDYIALG